MNSRSIPPLISKIKKFQTMHVVYKSVGCFHNNSHLLKFYPNRIVKIYVYTSGYPQDTKKIGELVLSNYDIEGLDSLIKFYHNEEMWYGCTTIDTITIKIKIGFITVKKVTYQDSSCSVNGERQYLSLNTLISHQCSRRNPQ